MSDMTTVGCLVINHVKKYLCKTVVPISPQATINELKQLLKGNSTIVASDVHIDMLEVWKCTSALEVVSDDLEELKENLLKLDLSDKQTAQMLCSSVKVSNLGLQENEMLLVRLPSSLWCLVVDPDQKPVCLIPVTVFPGIEVSNVKEIVLKEAHIEIGLADPTVWRCVGLNMQSNREDDREFEARVRTSLLHAERLCETSDVLELNVPPDEMLLVQLPNIRGDKRKHDENDEDDENGGLPPGLKCLKLEIAEVTPSSDEFQNITGLEHRIVFNRPFEPFTIPLVLLHKAFAIFKDRCLEAPSEQALIFLSELAPVACEWHGPELSRRTAVQSIIARHTCLQFHEQKVPGTEFTTDGNLAVVVMPAAIRECKNKHRYGLNHAISSYANFLSKAQEDPRRFCNFNTRFPSILMLEMGPFLGFYGAVWDGKCVRVEPLTRLFDLSVHERKTKIRCDIAASFDALMVAVNNIEAHYKSIEAEANSESPPKSYDCAIQKAREYPFLTSYEDNGQEINFMYNERLHDKVLIFSATQPDSDELIVKFTPWYSEDAHNYLASHNLAPRLRRCIRISADWTAVIMDKSKYQKLLGLQLSGADKEKVRHKVMSVVRLLHQEGFVHGDIREGNILIDEKSLTSDDVRIHLIDFDWAGPIGEAKYPADINKITVQRPHSVEGGGLITEEHDIKMASSFLFR